MNGWSAVSVTPSGTTTREAAPPIVHGPPRAADVRFAMTKYCPLSEKLAGLSPVPSGFRRQVESSFKFPEAVEKNDADVLVTTTKVSEGAERFPLASTETTVNAYWLFGEMSSTVNA